MQSLFTSHTNMSAKPVKFGFPVVRWFQNLLRQKAVVNVRGTFISPGIVKYLDIPLGFLQDVGALINCLFIDVVKDTKLKHVECGVFQRFLVKRTLDPEICIVPSVLCLDMVLNLLSATPHDNGENIS